ncbi:8690_t:CDS:2 [Ambispora gerdemannii]|uniref:8690_t:CDS:1 n=1 Tax=Ambispora gerdemannii TaxID=144530 RepID=A0A9N8ZMS9_9GLOM|nr:8690_t:CDS:2 [Ambispora gerdemannii]
MAKSFWESFKSLPPRTRIYLGLGGIAIGLTGNYISDKLEEKFPDNIPSNPPTNASGQTENASSNSQ